MKSVGFEFLRKILLEYFVWRAYGVWDSPEQKQTIPVGAGNFFEGTYHVENIPNFSWPHKKGLPCFTDMESKVTFTMIFILQHIPLALDGWCNLVANPPVSGAYKREGNP